MQQEKHWSQERECILPQRRSCRLTSLLMIDTAARLPGGIESRNLATKILDKSKKIQ